MDYARDVSELCTKIFEGASGPVMAFVPVLFLIRVIYASFTGSSEEIKATLKGTVLFFILINGFHLILDVLFAIPEAFLPSFRIPDQAEVDGAVQNFKAAKDIPYLVQYIVEALIALLYWVAAFLHVLFMALMSALAPVVFLLSCLLGIGLGLKLFFGLIVLASSWPIMWYGFEFFIKWADHSIHDTFGKVAIELIVTILKGIGPIGVAYLSINSGPGRALSAGAAQMAAGFGIGKAGAGLATGAFRSFASSVRKHTPNQSKNGSSSYGGGSSSRLGEGLENNRSQVSESREDGRLNSSEPQSQYPIASGRLALDQRASGSISSSQESIGSMRTTADQSSPSASTQMSFEGLDGPGSPSQMSASDGVTRNGSRAQINGSANDSSRFALFGNSTSGASHGSQAQFHLPESASTPGSEAAGTERSSNPTSSRLSEMSTPSNERKRPFLPDKNALSHSIQDHLVQDDHAAPIGR